jgi:hypothetical protein
VLGGGVLLGERPELGQHGLKHGGELGAKLVGEPRGWARCSRHLVSSRLTVLLLPPVRASTSSTVGSRSSSRSSAAAAAATRS